MELHSLAGVQVSPRSHDMSITPLGGDADAEASAGEGVVFPPDSGASPGRYSNSLAYTYEYDINVNSRNKDKVDFEPGAGFEWSYLRRLVQSHRQLIPPSFVCSHPWYDPIIRQLTTTTATTTTTNK